MRKDQIEAARGEIAKSVVEIGWGFSLYQRGFGAELGLDKFQSMISGGIPPRVARQVRV